MFKALDISLILLYIFCLIVGLILLSTSVFYIFNVLKLLKSEISQNFKPNFAKIGVF